MMSEARQKMRAERLPEDASGLWLSAYIHAFTAE
jgi:hypothetical protein